jgi:chromosome segregation ATPase
LSDYALRFGLALLVVIVACAAIIISRRNYAKSADSEHSIEAFRVELQRSIDAAQAATIKTIRDNIFSVIKTINSTVRDLSVRLARLEERVNETATHIAGTQNLDVRLAGLEQHVDATATYGENLDARLARLEERTDETATHIATTQSLDVRLARLEERADETATQIAGTQKQSLEENERIAARLAGLEQNLTALSDQLSLIKQTIDGATVREQDIKNSIEAIDSRIMNTQTRVDELFPRLALGEKALTDLGTLISLFVKRLKRVNANSTEIVQRLGDLESHFRLKFRQLEEPHSSILERKDGPSTSNIEDLIEAATPKAADGAIPTEANTGGENSEGFERATTPGQQSSKKAIVEEEGRSDNSRADQHAT